MAMNLAEVAEALTQKDSERSTIQGEVQKLTEAQSQGIEKLIRLAAKHIVKDGEENSQVVFSYSVSHNSEQSHTAKASGAIVEFPLRSENDVIDIVADTIADEASATTPVSYIAQLSVSAVTAEDEWTDATVEAVDGDDADKKVTLYLTAMKIDINKVKAEKEEEIASKSQEIAEIQTQLKAVQAAAQKEAKEAKEAKAAKKASTVTTGKGKKSSASSSSGAKKKKASKSVGIDEDEDDSENKVVATKKASYFPSWASVQRNVLAYGGLGLNLAVTHRAYFFFAAAAGVIAVYGEYASV